LSPAEWKETMGTLTADFDGHIEGGQGKRALALSDGAEVAMAVVLRLTAAYSTPSALNAELGRQMHRAAQTYDFSIRRTIAGHDVIAFSHDDLDNWYWVSGKEFVIVVTTHGDRAGKAFVRGLAELTL